MTIRSVKKTTSKRPIIAMSVTGPLVMISTATAAAAHAMKSERPAHAAPSIPSSLQHFGPECTFGTMNSECRRKLEGIDFEDEGLENIDDDMDDLLTTVLPEDITITQHGISESWIDEMVWDKDAMDLFEQIHPRSSSGTSHKRPGGSSVKVKESVADSNSYDDGDDRDKESMYEKSEELPDSMTDGSGGGDDDDNGEKIKSESSKMIPSKKSESGKKKSTSKSSYKKDKGSWKNLKDRSNLRKRGQSTSSKSKSASSSTSQDEGVPSHVPTQSPSTISYAFVDEPAQSSNVPSDLPSIVPSGTPSFSWLDDDDDVDDNDDILPTQDPSTTSPTATIPTVPTTTGSEKELDVSVIVVDIDCIEADDDDDDDDGNDSFASPGMMSAMVGLGILVGGAVGVQSYFRRRDSPPPSSDGDDDMETVDL